MLSKNCLSLLTAIVALTTTTMTIFWNGPYAFAANINCAGIVYPAVCSGTNQKDTILGDDNKNVICGLAGNDNIVPKGGSDNAFGGAGDDKIDGGEGDDGIIGDNVVSCGGTSTWNRYDLGWSRE